VQTKHSYWIFQDVVSEKDRRKIKRVASKSGYKLGTLKSDSHEEGKPAEKKVRDTDVAFSNSQYLYDIFCPFVHIANKNAGWEYDIDWFESVQIARYKKNQHYAWHADGIGDHFGVYPDDAHNNYKGKVRKLSLISCISNGFDGGEFQISVQNDIDNENSTIIPELGEGDVVVFPSFLNHRSTPVTKGTKYSVAMWCLGPPFK
tara:strand:+ start:421 stop:1029 length:609 start_codon:yes stop_codon:yes gene_type:complete